ncbi:UNVERIFIED_CONTAM: hypothetical protein GTU68_046663 [Idotea baltica]|nr:hypothetical protein [Idotea baltica]
MDELRTQCPWDRKQTIESLRILTIEETYELVEAISAGDWENLKEELGDLLLHIIFYAKIGEEKGHFDIASVIHDLCEKLIRRHPHIYGDTKVSSEEEVLQNWEKIKLQEKGKTSALGGVPKSLPALPKALRIQEKAKKIGFDWDNKKDVWAKVKEEMLELEEAVAENNVQNIEEEYGDLLFSLANYARFIKVDPEGALEKTNIKFVKRFQLMESIASAKNLDISSLSLAKMDELWDQAKDIIKQETKASQNKT